MAHPKGEPNAFLKTLVFGSHWRGRRSRTPEIQQASGKTEAFLRPNPAISHKKERVLKENPFLRRRKYERRLDPRTYQEGSNDKVV
ncbi:MAG: hypothetical protein MJZ26_01235 [Fibrobacter sp.]|nr:hypothetical protein [Fibrobacter sp.]